MATSTERSHPETEREGDLLVRFGELRGLPPRGDTAAFLEWIVRMRNFTHDDLPTVTMSDPSLVVTALQLMGRDFPWRSDSASGTLIEALDFETLSHAAVANRLEGNGGLSGHSIERLLRIQHMTALVGRELAREPGLGSHVSADGVYFLGMTHRLGEVAVLSLIHRADGVAGRDVLRGNTGPTTVEITRTLASRWNLPQDLIACLVANHAESAVPKHVRGDLEILAFAEEIVRGLPSLGRPGAGFRPDETGARRPARLRIRKDRLETIVWSAYAECASAARLLHPWVE